MDFSAFYFAKKIKMGFFFDSKMNDKNPKFGLFRCSVGLKRPIMGFFYWFGVKRDKFGLSVVSLGSEKLELGPLSLVLGQKSPNLGVWDIGFRTESRSWNLWAQK